MGVGAGSEEGAEDAAALCGPERRCAGANRGAAQRKALSGAGSERCARRAELPPAAPCSCGVRSLLSRARVTAARHMLGSPCGSGAVRRLHGDTRIGSAALHWPCSSVNAVRGGEHRCCRVAGLWRAHQYVFLVQEVRPGWCRQQRTAHKQWPRCDHRALPGRAPLPAGTDGQCCYSGTSWGGSAVLSSVAAGEAEGPAQ